MTVFNKISQFTPVHDMMQWKQQVCKILSLDFFWGGGSRQYEVFLSHLQKANLRSPFNQRWKLHWRNKKDWYTRTSKWCATWDGEILHDLGNLEERERHATRIQLSCYKAKQQILFATFEWITPKGLCQEALLWLVPWSQIWQLMGWWWPAKEGCYLGKLW